jgi:acetyl/propionyl-CoA carboxylase alpha subunit
MNTRIQVEHPVTECVTGLDLVREQFRMAAGEAVPAVPPARGHAIELRVIAEDPARGFVPSPGRIARWSPPEGPGIRVDAGVCEGFTVPAEYDSLLAKLVVHAPDREAARARLTRAIDEFCVGGVPTTLELGRAIVASPDFAAGRVHTRWLDAFMESWRPSPDSDLALLAAWALAASPAPAGAVASPELPSPFLTLGRTP